MFIKTKKQKKTKHIKYSGPSIVETFRNPTKSKSPRIMRNSVNLESKHLFFIRKHFFLRTYAVVKTLR